ncbi:ATP-binding protein [Clostridium pasteurianum]|uniref:HAMP domain-containing sensor histidine kinase n=1 Tax=Clostridium pasteurianum TaxID=1501 RepID=UPI002260B5F6|nr:HAMP domain-containing sensor histidine kinase [Clostridium pasteurianum]UZW12413.1 ATP-binding protein [Clostridium pasteurianum]
MKKKIKLYTLFTIFFTLIIVTLLFISLINYQYEQNTKLKLKDNNKFIITVLDFNDLNKTKEFLNKEYISSDISVTIITKYNNDIIFSSDKDINGTNKNFYYESIKTKNSKDYYAIKYSNISNRNIMYYGTKYNNYIILSSQPLNLRETLKVYYLKYYAFMMIVVLLMSFWFAKKLSDIIIKPIKDLETIADMVDKGEFKKSIMIDSDDELASLGEKFNNMAQKLKLTMKDSLDKQNRMEAILKSMESGVVAVNRNRKVILINPYAEMLFGIEENIIGKNLMDSIRDFEIEDVFKSDFTDFKEVKILWPEEKVIRIKTTDIVNGKKHIGKVAVFQDITDIRKLENMRSQFVANVSHELKTPLTSIKGFTETLKYVVDNEKRIKFLDIIDEEVERLTRLINDILTLSHIEAHKEMKQEIFFVDDIINNVYNLMKNIAKNKNISLSIIENSHIKLSGDKDRFKQMLINLVDNAVKYSESNDRVYVSSTIENNMNIIVVEDTGLGISKEHIKRLFERFYRVDKARSRAKGGTGLGLAIVKHIVLNFGGTIEVESELGEGSKFIIKLPLTF